MQLLNVCCRDADKLQTKAARANALPLFAVLLLMSEEIYREYRLSAHIDWSIFYNLSGRQSAQRLLLTMVPETSLDHC